MKQFFLFTFLIVISSALSAQTISYQPLHGNYTQYLYRTQSWNGGQSTDNYLKTIWSGDTVIGGENYVRIFQYGMYYGGIREDVSNQQRFFIDKNDIEYDITISPFLSVGDVLSDTTVFLKTFRAYCDLGPGMYEFFDTLTVDQIDSTLEDDGNYSTTYFLRKLPYPVSFIYNSYRGLQHFQALEFNCDQLCYREDGEQTPPGQETPWTGMCDLGIDEATLFQVNLFPNPSTECVFLSGDVSLVKNAVIYNMQGIRVKELSGTELQAGVSLKELKSGVYFLSLNGNTRVLRFQKI